MPTYRFQCDECDNQFEKFFFTVKKAKEEVECPECGEMAKKVFTAPGINRVRRKIDKEFSDDPKEYREMHYYEKKKDWKKAAKAADGVSDFAKRKFQQKAREKGSK